MRDDLAEAMQQVQALVEETRSTCLWYVRQDYVPQTVEQALPLLDAIARHGDLATFRRVAELRTWLPRASSASSAAS